MDNQQIFNIVVSIAGFLAVYVFNNTTRQIQKLEDKINELPKEYVAKDDYRSDITEIKSILKQIFDKLDNKADKWEKIVTSQPNADSLVIVQADRLVIRSPSKIFRIAIFLLTFDILLCRLLGLLVTYLYTL